MIDSGFRCHTTSFARATAAAPSPFVTRLRKFLKTRRVTSVSQVGTDRIIELQFSDGQYRLYLEFYAGGNIILTDNELNVLALLRNVSEGEAHEQLKLGVKYNLELRQNYGGIPPLTKERIREGLQKAVAKQKDDDQKGKKSKGKAKDALRKALATTITEFPPMLVDHAFQETGFDATRKPEDVLQDDAVLDDLLSSLEEAGKVDREITSADSAKGYIIAKKAPTTSEQQEHSEGADEAEKKAAANLLYEDFHPFKPRQLAEKIENIFLEFDGFNKTVDEYFSSIEGQKLESRLTEREAAAKKKLENARKEHENRIGGLQQVQELNVRRAEAIQANVERVQEAAAAINGLIAQGMDWVEIERLIEREQRHGNPVADMIKLPLKLYENAATLLLSEPIFDSNVTEDEGYDTDSDVADSEDENEDEPATQRQVGAKSKTADSRLPIDIDLGLSPWANASQYYDQKRTAADKEERTKLASGQALKSTEKKIQADLKRGLQQEKEVLRPVRKQFWFERFSYFISSDGYLVLGGKDAQQNEMLYKRYFRKGDVYVHADLHGAATVVIKNNPQTPDAPIPPSTLAQAGNLSVCTSSAWDSKAGMGAWWVEFDQVSKTAPTGEYLTTGSFMIRGKKNFLPPAQLLLGFAVMFQMSEDSKANHVKHRIVDKQAESEAAADAQASANEAAQVDDTGPDESHDEDDEDDEHHAKHENALDEDDEDSDDEDFPDVRLSADEADDGPRSNPLQSAKADEKEADDDEGDAVAEDDVRGRPVEEKDGEDDDEKEDGEDLPTGTTVKEIAGHRHLSARERRLLRQGKTLDFPSTASGTDEEEPKAAKNDASTVGTKAKGPAPLPRGKRAKAKKAAQKYAEQDEEDRDLALRLLGGKTQKENVEVAAETKRNEREELEAAKQRRREQHLRAQEKGKADEAARFKREQVDVAEGNEGAEPGEADEESARLELMGLDSFTGRPLAGDELLSAIPVVAPWSALATYKYKVKLQPGGTKKGKAVKEILGRWDVAFKEAKYIDKESKDQEKMWPREIELVKQWKEAEIFGVLPVSKVRVVLGGGAGSVKDSHSGKGKKKAPQRGQKKKK